MKVSHAQSSEISLRSVTTLSIWIACLAVGLIGVVIPYARPRPPQSLPPPLQAELLEVALTTDPIAADNVTPPPTETLMPPPAVQPLTPPSAPALIPVEVPNSAIAFELPVTGPTRIVEAREASYSAPVKAPVENTGTRPAVQQLTFGQGEGKQLAPTYPPRAKEEGQEGEVRIGITVGTNGRVLAAEVLAKSPWPLLNEEAVRTVRQSWRFTPGPVRHYEVPIHFRLRKTL
jgi:protein TonB